MSDARGPRLLGRGGPPCLLQVATRNGKANVALGNPEGFVSRLTPYKIGPHSKTRFLPKSRKSQPPLTSASVLRDVCLYFHCIVDSMGMSSREPGSRYVRGLPGSQWHWRMACCLTDGDAGDLANDCGKDVSTTVSGNPSFSERCVCF